MPFQRECGCLRGESCSECDPSPADKMRRRAALLDDALRCLEGFRQLNTGPRELHDWADRLLKHRRPNV